MRLFLLPLLLLASCFARSAIIRPSFDSFTVGTPIQEVKSKAGDPYAIQERKKGLLQYEYIERIPLGSEIVEENHYYLIIQDGKVVAKWINQETPPPFEFIFDEDPNSNE